MVQKKIKQVPALGKGENERRFLDRLFLLIGLKLN
jgi:hypothetical protein